MVDTSFFTICLFIFILWLQFLKKSSAECINNLNARRLITSVMNEIRFIFLCYKILRFFCEVLFSFLFVVH